MTKHQFSLIFLLCTMFVARADRDVIFLGLGGEGAPAVEKTYDRLLREHLSLIPDINLVDYVEAQQYKARVRFDDYPVVSKSLIDKLDQFASDSTIIVWGTVKKYTIYPVRHYLFGAAIKGELTITLNMYSLANKKYLFTGDVASTTKKHKSLIFITPVNKIIHISALERTEILEKLEHETIQASGRMISSVARSDLKSLEVRASIIATESEIFAVPPVGNTVVVDSSKEPLTATVSPDEAKDNLPEKSATIKK